MTSDAEHLADLLRRGKLLTEHRSLVEARRVLEEAVLYAEKVHGPDSLETRDVLELLRRAIGLARMDDPALFPLAERMVRISLAAFGPSDRRMHRPMGFYAFALELVGRTAEALSAYARAFELAQPEEECDVVLLFCYVRALSEARRTEEALGVVDRIRELEAHEPPGKGFSPLAVCAVADAAKSALVLRYIDEKMSLAADADRQLNEVRVKLRESTG